MFMFVVILAAIMLSDAPIWPVSPIVYNGCGADGAPAERPFYGKLRRVRCDDGHYAWVQD